MKKIVSIVSAFLFCMPFVGISHPGHGETGGYTITHYFTEPVHVFVNISLLIALVLFIRYSIKGKQKQNS